MGAVKKVILGLDQAIEFLTKFLLFIVVMGMLFLSVTSIFLRWFDTSYAWMEPLIRHLVFISAFLGGVLATGRGTHIGIDILSKYFETIKDYRKLRVLKIISSLAACITLTWLAYASWGFVQLELEFGRNVFWGIHSGVLVGIIPVGMGLITYRFFAKLFTYLFYGISEEEIAEIESYSAPVEQVQEDK